MTMLHSKQFMIGLTIPFHLYIHDQHTNWCFCLCCMHPWYHQIATWDGSYLVAFIWLICIPIHAL